MDLSQFYSQFREETIENIRILNDGLLALEGAPDLADPTARGHIDAMFRATHTVKGSARLLGFAEVGRLAHTMEDVLGAVRAGHMGLDRALTDHLLRGGDLLLELSAAAVDGRPSDAVIDPLLAELQASLDAIAGTAPAEPPAAASQPDTAVEPAPATPQAPPPPPADPAPSAPPQAQPEPGAKAAQPIRTRSTNRDTVRVRTDRLDRLINLTGELVIGQQTLAMHNQTLRDLVGLSQQQEHALLKLDSSMHEHALNLEQRTALQEQLNTMLNICDQMRQMLRSETEQFSLYISQNHSLVDDLEQEVISTRLLPISTIFAALPRAVRELANATGKEVQLDVRGETTELDRKLLEALHDPLIHLVRNAVDHGIEPPDERLAAGKPRQGQVQIVAEAIGGEVRVGISDDGRGIEPQRMRDVAVRKGLIGADQAAALSDQEALELVFLPGFTSAKMLTDISGRGVGLDVVRTNISELSGQVQLESQPGQGTHIALLLPLTLVTTRILLIQVGHQTFALSANGCRGIIWVDEQHIDTIDGRATILHNDQTVPVVRMADLLDVEARPLFEKTRRLPAVLLGSDKRLLSVLVDKVLDEREAVVKPVGPLLELGRRYTGAIQLGTGQLVLMLNPMTLVQMARGIALTQPTAPGADLRSRPRLLVAEDSFTTRELLRSILNSAGYEVTPAVDGADALDKLRGQSYDLVVSDVEMPRMNGFDLTASIRQELGLHDLPVIIVTSLASDEHRRRGLEAGAQAYIVKSQFNQDNLLDAIRQLLGSELTRR